VIPNGFEDADFAQPRALATTAAFRIVHTGYLHTAAGRRERRLRYLRRILGGAAPGVDILARSHVHLLEAVDEIVRSGALPPESVEVHLAGVLSPDDLAVAERYPFVRVHGYLAHEEAIALMQSADLLYLPMQGLPPGTRATIVPGKTYEYLASGTAILAAVPEGDARDLLTEAGKTWAVPPGDRSAIGAAIVAAAQGSEPERPERSPTVLLRYERRHLTSRLAATLELVARNAAREATAKREPERASAAATRVPGAEAAR
jgi:glycosyltransferase involved in cell wall biosynthesis